MKPDEQPQRVTTNHHSVSRRCPQVPGMIRAREDSNLRPSA